MSSTRLAFALFGIVCFFAGCLATSRYRNEKPPRFRPGLPEECRKEADTRPCLRAVAFRWYYDKFSDSCKVFPYRGCQSNGNNFKNKDDCINRCIKQIEHTKHKGGSKDNDQSEVILNDFVGEEAAVVAAVQNHVHQRQQSGGWRIGDENWPSDGTESKSSQRGQYYTTLPWDPVQYVTRNTYKRDSNTYNGDSWKSAQPERGEYYIDPRYSYNSPTESTRQRSYEPVTRRSDDYRPTERYDERYNYNPVRSYQDKYYDSKDHQRSARENPTEEYYVSDYRDTPIQQPDQDRYYKEQRPVGQKGYAKTYFRNEGQQGVPRSPSDEYYYDQHKRPANVPPNVYLYGEGPVRPSEVPVEIHNYSPKKKDKYEQRPVVETYEASHPNAPRKKKGGDIKQRGFAPKPFQGAFPGIPKDPTIRRFQLRNGWVIEIIIGGFRAIKDERKINGWKHVYARIYEEAPDGSAGHSVWMFQSEFDSRFRAKKRPQYGNHQAYKVRRKRGVSRDNGMSDHPFPLFSSEKPRSWHPRADRLDEIYGEPVAKSAVHRREPYFEVDNGRGMQEKGDEPPRRALPPSRPYMYRPRAQDQGPVPGLRRPSPEDMRSAPGHRRPAPGDMRPAPGHRRPAPGDKRPSSATSTTVTTHRTRSRPEGRLLNQGQRPQERHTLTETHVNGDNHREDSFVSESEVVHNTGSELPRRSEEMFAPNMFTPRTDEESSEKDDSDHDGLDDDLDIDADLGIDDEDDDDDQAGERTDDDDDNDSDESDDATDDDASDDDNSKADKETETEDTPQLSGVCHQHPETGPCKAYIRRWYFDTRQHQCVSFIYGGCRGNANNFPTKEDCVRSCHPSDQAVEQSESPAPSQENPAPEKENTKEETENQSPPGAKSLPQVKPDDESVRTPENKETPESKETPDDESPELPADPSDNEPPLRSEVPDFTRDTDDDMASSSTENDNSDDTSGSRSESSESSEEDRSPEEHTNDIEEDDHRGPLDEGQQSSDEELPRPDDNPTGDSSRPVLRRPNLFNSPLSLFSYYLNRLKPTRPLAVLRKRTEKAPEIKKGTTFMRIFLTNTGSKNRNAIGAVPHLSNRPFPPRRIVFGSMNMLPSHKQPSQRTEYRAPMISRWPNRMRMEKIPAQSMEPFHPNRYPPRKYLNQPTSSSFHDRPQYSSRLRQPYFVHHNAPYNRPYVQRRPIEEHTRGQPMRKNMICLERVDVGNCHGRMPVPRWYYDPRTGSCDVFYYSGCSGNNNRFTTLEQCRSNCMESYLRSMPRERPLAREEKRPEEQQPRRPNRPASPEVISEEKPKEEVEVSHPEKAEPQVHEKTDNRAPEPVVHTIEFAHMHLDNRMEYGLVLAIMVLGGLALLVLIALTVYFMYKKHKLRTRPNKETTVQAVVRAHAYPEVHKISVVELPVELAGIHNVALGGQQ